MKNLEAEILKVKGISRSKSRYSDLTAFFSAKKEIAHFHNEHEIDIRLTSEKIGKYRKRIAADPDNNVRAQWATVQFYTDADIEFVVELIRVAAKANLDGK